MSRPVLISFEHLTKEFRTDKNQRYVAVKDLSFQVAEGEALSLWGANGAGKTTVIKCLLGLLPVQGSIRLLHYTIPQDGKMARRMIGYVPQEMTFYDMTTWQTIDFFARLKHVAADHALELLQWVGLGDHMGKMVSTLSGGMKQRLALALALLSDPPLLVLDEPTSNLDSRGREEFIALLKRLKAQGKTILFTSHRLEEVETLADRVLVLEEGRLVCECAPAELPLRLNGKAAIRLKMPLSQAEQALQALKSAGIEGFEIEGFTT